jgi:hypothetical protein
MSAFEYRGEPKVEPKTSLTTAAKWLDEAMRETRLKNGQLRRRRPSGKAVTERHHRAELAQRT